MSVSNRVIHTIRQLDRSVRVRGLLHTARLAIRVFWQEGFAGVRVRLDALGPALRAQKVPQGTVILTMPHTLHFARRLQAVLEECGITAQVADSDRAARSAKLVFAIAPQNFPAVPADRLVAFQVEQCIAADRWTPAYLDRLSKCLAVWDFSTYNISRLREHVPFSNIYHVPFWPIPNVSSDTVSASRQDILFYGDTSSPRRQRILAALKAALPELQIESNLFGPLMNDRLDRAAIVVNIHAQEGALLETARISEALSHGCVVVSETACDAGPQASLMPGLFLVPEDDPAALIATLRQLSNPAQRCGVQAQSISPQPDRFRLAVLRALQGMGLISTEQFDALATDYPQAAPDGTSPRLCLSLPESSERAQSFLSANDAGFRIWPGLKAVPGWRGAALSYRRIFRELRDKTVPEALIVEDDVVLPADFDNSLTTIRAAMDRSGADMFSGLIVDLHKDARVLNVERCEGLVLVHLDRAVMMICNLYRTGMIQYLADWDPQDDNPFTNTIDRYMERATHLRVITTLPFLASYRPEAKSTLRKSNNRVFDSMLERSEAELARKVSEFESSL